MAKPYSITITNGTGSGNVLNGSYTTSANVTGYVSTVTPETLNVVEGTNSYELKIGATGTLTLHVTEEGTEDGTPVVGATFYRTDELGNTYGNIVTTNENGNAVFEHIPWDTVSAPTVYYKETASDGEHEFDSNNKNTTLTTETKIIEIENKKPASRTFTLTDEYYDNLVIPSGTITLS